MSSRVPLRALRVLVHDGQTIRPGETFNATPIEAAALVYQRVAAFLVISDVDVRASSKRRRYQRRDMQAES